MTVIDDAVAQASAIERRSIYYIPDRERYGRPFNRFTLLLGANLQMTVGRAPLACSDARPVDPAARTSGAIALVGCGAGSSVGELMIGDVRLLSSSDARRDRRSARALAGCRPLS